MTRELSYWFHVLRTAVLLLAAGCGGGTLYASGRAERVTCHASEGAPLQGTRRASPCEIQDEPVVYNEFFSLVLERAFFVGEDGTLQRLFGKNLIIEVEGPVEGQEGPPIHFIRTQNASQEESGFLPVQGVPILFSQAIRAGTLSMRVRFYTSSAEQISAVKELVGSISRLASVPGLGEEITDVTRGAAQVLGLSAERAIIELELSQFPGAWSGNGRRCSGLQTNSLCEGVLVLAVGNADWPSQIRYDRNRLVVRDSDEDSWREWTRSSYLVLSVNRGFSLSEVARERYTNLLRGMLNGSTALAEDMNHLRSVVPYQFWPTIERLVAVYRWVVSVDGVAMTPGVVPERLRLLRDVVETIGDGFLDWMFPRRSSDGVNDAMTLKSRICRVIQEERNGVGRLNAPLPEMPRFCSASESSAADPSSSQEDVPDVDDPTSGGESGVQGVLIDEREASEPGIQP